MTATRKTITPSGRVQQGIPRKSIDVGLYLEQRYPGDTASDRYGASYDEARIFRIDRSTQDSVTGTVYIGLQLISGKPTKGNRLMTVSSVLTNYRLINAATIEQASKITKASAEVIQAAIDNRSIRSFRSPVNNAVLVVLEDLEHAIDKFGLPTGKQKKPAKPAPESTSTEAASSGGTSTHVVVNARTVARELMHELEQVQGGSFTAAVAQSIADKIISNEYFIDMVAGRLCGKLLKLGLVADIAREVVRVIDGATAPAPANTVDVNGVSVHLPAGAQSLEETGGKGVEALRSGADLFNVFDPADGKRIEHHER